MKTRGIDVGTLTDDAYMNVTEVDDYLVRPLFSATSEVEDAVYFAEGAAIDNPYQKEYIRTQIENLIYNLKKLDGYLEG